MNALSLLAKLKQLDIRVEVVEERLKIDAPKGTLTPGLVAELKEKKEEVIEFLQNDVRGRVRFASVQPSEKREYYELSSAQKRLYFLQRFNPARTDYNKPEVTELDGLTDPARLEETFGKLIRRHESLRTSFEMLGNRPVQKIHPHVEFRVEYLEAKGPLDGIFRDFIRPFDLGRVPLLRVLLVKAGEKKFLLMVDIHHIISDGISRGILLQDFGALYGGRSLPPLKLQYKDYARWQNSESQKNAVKRQEAFWLEQFGGQLPVLYLPTDHPRPSNRSLEGDWLYFELNPEDTAALKQVVLDTGATLYIVLLALYNILMAKLSGQEDIIIGTMAAGRPHADFQQIIGMFVNTLALRNFPSGEKIFGEFLKEVKQRTLRAFENQDYQFEDLVEKVGVQRDPGRNPLFDVRFALQNIAENNGGVPPGDDPAGPGANPYTNRVSKFDLSLYGTERGDRLHFGIEYCTRLYKAKTIAVIFDYFKNILSQALEAPDRKIKEIDVLTREEKERMLYEINANRKKYPKTAAVHRLFEEQVRKTPDNTAVVFEDNRLTYRELNARANRLARLLRERGMKPGTTAAVVLNRGLEEITGIFGVMKTGGTCLPLDPACRDDWTEFILADANPRWLVCGGGVPGRLTDGRETVVMEQVDFTPYGTGNPDNVNEWGDPAVVTYTSGPTGKPRGIMIGHGPTVNLLYGHSAAYPAGESGRFLLKSSAPSHVYLLELFGWVPGGGGLVLLEQENEDAPRRILDILARERITHIYFLPQKFNAFTAFLIKSDTDDLAELKYLFYVGNERLTLAVNLFKREDIGISPEVLYSPPGCALYTCGFSTAHWDGGGKMPIGKPRPNVKLFILDRLGRLQGPGVPGDLYISGEGAAGFFLNDPELTANRWAPNPLVKDGKLFKTGDYGRYLHDGGIEFRGSGRHRVVAKGAVIDVNETASQILRYFGTKQAVVIPGREEGGEVSLTAYFTAQKEIDVSELRGYLSRELPGYMVPSHFVPIEEMPFTPDGNIDRAALPEPGTGIHRGYVPPGSDTEEALCEMWAEILEIPKAEIGVEDNFFELGGGSNSLHLIMLASKIYETFDVQMPITQIYNSPVIREIARFLESRDLVTQPMVLLNRSREKKLFCFPPRIGYGMLYTSLASLIDDYSVYAFSFIEEDDRLERYVDIIRGIQPHGPYVLFGMSAAGRLTVQVANALEKSGCEVSDIIFADCFYYERHQYKFNQDYFDEYYDRVENNLEKLGLSHIKEEVLEKTSKYMEYYHSLPPLEVINAEVHMVLSEQVQLKIQNGDPLVDTGCWDKWTRKQTFLYRGFGEHEDMFLSDALEKNAKIVREILTAISSKNRSPGKNKDAAGGR